jgi:RNA methyltransferase, TrmH family
VTESRGVTRITSRTHPLVKQFRQTARGDEKLALLDGWHLLQEAASAAVPLEAVALAGDPPDATAARTLEALARRQVRIESVSRAVLEAMSPVRTPSGVVALALRPAVELPRLLRPDPALVVVAIDVQDPGNLGSIVRAAEAGGATGVIAAGASADPWSWKALRAAMGSTFRLPALRRRDESTVLDELRQAGVMLVATVPRSGVAMQDVDFSKPVGVIVGGEGPGLDDRMLTRADARVSIPMQNPVESLNVSIAAALLVYEARRQRHMSG